MVRPGLMVGMAVAAGCGWLVDLAPSAAESVGASSRSSTAPAIDRGPLIHDLALVSDFVPHFDDAAFYGLLDLAADSTNRPDAALAITPTPVTWDDLTERPAQFRGRLVRFRGIVESSRRFELARTTPGGDPDLRTLLQTEISTPGAAKIFTVISAQPGPPAAVRISVEVSGWFLKVRRFKTAGGGDSYGPVIVASTVLPLALPGKSSTDNQTRRALFLGTGLLAIGWLMVRRLTRRAVRPHTSPAPPRTIEAERADFAWLTEHTDPTSRAKGDDSH